jgi:hypothetical protein
VFAQKFWIFFKRIVHSLSLSVCSSNAMIMRWSRDQRPPYNTYTIALQMAMQSMKKPLRGHKRIFFMGMKFDIKDYIRQCEVCQRTGTKNTKPSRLLQPLPIHEKPWSWISIDFIEGLTNFNKYYVILVVVDKLSKYARFIPLIHPYNVCKVAWVFA